MIFRSLSRTSVSKDLRKETKKNSDLFQQTLNLGKTDAALLINGLHFDMDFTDIFTILNTVRLIMLRGIKRNWPSNELINGLYIMYTLYFETNNQ